MQEREQAIQEEIARLEKLQRLAEKVHKEASTTDNKLDDIEAWIEEEVSLPLFFYKGGSFLPLIKFPTANISDGNFSVLADFSQTGFLDFAICISSL